METSSDSQIARPRFRLERMTARPNKRSTNCYQDWRLATASMSPLAEKASHLQATQDSIAGIKRAAADEIPEVKNLNRSTRFKRAKVARLDYCSSLNDGLDYYPQVSPSTLEDQTDSEEQGTAVPKRVSEEGEQPGENSAAVKEDQSVAELTQLRDEKDRLEHALQADIQDLKYRLTQSEDGARASSEALQNRNREIHNAYSQAHEENAQITAQAQQKIQQQSDIISGMEKEHYQVTSAQSLRIAQLLNQIKQREEAFQADSIEWSQAKENADKEYNHTRALLHQELEEKNQLSLQNQQLVDNYQQIHNKQGDLQNEVQSLREAVSLNEVTIQHQDAERLHWREQASKCYDSLQQEQRERKQAEASLRAEIAQWQSRYHVLESSISAQPFSADGYEAVPKEHGETSRSGYQYMGDAQGLAWSTNSYGSWSGQQSTGSYYGHNYGSPSQQHSGYPGSYGTTSQGDNASELYFYNQAVLNQVHGHQQVENSGLDDSGYISEEQAEQITQGEVKRKSTKEHAGGRGMIPKKTSSKDPSHLRKGGITKSTASSAAAMKKATKSEVVKKTDFRRVAKIEHAAKKAFNSCIPTAKPTSFDPNTMDDREKAMHFYENQMYELLHAVGLYKVHWSSDRTSAVYFSECGDKILKIEISPADMSPAGPRRLMYWPDDLGDEEWGTDELLTDPEYDLNEYEHTVRLYAITSVLVCLPQLQLAAAGKLWSNLNDADKLQSFAKKLREVYGDGIESTCREQTFYSSEWDLAVDALSVSMKEEFEYAIESFMNGHVRPGTYGCWPPTQYKRYGDLYESLQPEDDSEMEHHIRGKATATAEQDELVKNAGKILQDQGEEHGDGEDDPMLALSARMGRDDLSTQRESLPSANGTLRGMPEGSLASFGLQAAEIGDADGMS